MNHTNELVTFWHVPQHEEVAMSIYEQPQMKEPDFYSDWIFLICATMGHMQQCAQVIILRNSDTSVNTWRTAHAVVHCCDLQNLTC